MTYEFGFSASLYPKEVIIKTAYSLTGENYVHLDMKDGNFIFIITPKCEENSKENVKNILDNAIISELARYTVSEKTKDIRKIILARAFASSIIDDEELPAYEGGYVSAPEKILCDWFENHGK